jgi:hypothetical protein
MKITYELLVKKGACEEQRNKFRERFPEGVELTRELCVANASEFSIEWAAENFLNKKQRADYEAKRVPLDADYRAKRAPLDADYRAKIAPLDADYRAKIAPLDADYAAKIAPLDADYAAKHDALYADYAAKRAGAFFDATLI